MPRRSQTGGSSGQSLFAFESVITDMKHKFESEFSDENEIFHVQAYLQHAKLFKDLKIQNQVNVIGVIDAQIGHVEVQSTGIMGAYQNGTGGQTKVKPSIFLCITAGSGAEIPSMVSMLKGEDLETMSFIQVTDNLTTISRQINFTAPRFTKCVFWPIGQFELLGLEVEARAIESTVNVENNLGQGKGKVSATYNASSGTVK